MIRKETAKSTIYTQYIRVIRAIRKSVFYCKTTNLSLRSSLASHTLILLTTSVSSTAHWLACAISVWKVTYLIRQLGRLDITLYQKAWSVRNIFPTLTCILNAFITLSLLQYARTFLYILLEHYFYTKWLQLLSLKYILILTVLLLMITVSFFNFKKSTFIFMKQELW